MAYHVPLPVRPGGRSPGYIDLVDGQSTAVQRAIRRDGLCNYEPPTMAAMLALFEIQQADFTFFDVGANVGLYTLICSKFFPESTVVGFEPTPGTVQIARKLNRVNQTGATIEQLALGETPGTAELYLSAVSDASNSLVEGFKENTGTVTVQVTTLDQFVRDRKLRPDVIKIDTESFEPQVLAGGAEVLSVQRPALIVEVLNRKGHDNGEEMTAAMAGTGYYYYPCSVYSEWKPVETIVGDTGRDRDWLLSPDPLPDDFVDRVEAWERVLSRCTVDRNTQTLPRSAAEKAPRPEASKPPVNKATRLAKGAMRRVRAAAADLIGK